MTRDHMPISAAALRLGLDYQQCRRLILTGRLAGGRDLFGRLYADTDAVERLKQERDDQATASNRRRGHGQRLRRSV